METLNANNGKRVTFQRFLYQKDASDSSSYGVAIYRLKTPMVTPNGRQMDTITATGYGLPHCETLEYDIFGEWVTNKKYGVQYKVWSYREIVPETKEGIIAYLSSGQLKGVGKATAKQLYDKFGSDILRILDDDPDRLLEVKGISERKLERIKQSYIETRGARDIIAFLHPRGVPINRCIRVYKRFRNDAMGIVTQHPYKLCEISGIGFATADSIALSAGLNPASEERVAAAISQTLKDAETSGNLCVDKNTLVNSSLKLLETKAVLELLEQAQIPKETVINPNIVAAIAGRMRNNGQLVTRGAMCYRPETEQAESDIARLIAKRIFKMQDGNIANTECITEALHREEDRLGYKLDEQQRMAVSVAIYSYMSVITGGPGTGKTTIERAILDIYSEKHPDKTICCCAPTGRAARRMAESTGYPSSTIHSLLKITPDDDDTTGDYKAPVLDADLVIVDEFSMVDVWVARALFSALKPNAQLVIIGDADQLPSVGAGAVLSEILSCKQLFSVVRLDTVHRQAKGSNIAENASLIRHGCKDLIYADDFCCIESEDQEQSARICCDLYMDAVAKNGLDQVCLLTPFRTRGATCVKSINQELRDRCNPPALDKAEIVTQYKTFRVGDRVMQLKNVEEIANGDCGYITKIANDSDGEMIVTVDFGDGRTEELDHSNLNLIDLAYAMTIHKSQGSEYRTVILNLQKSHYIMLKRPLIYTGITRAKENVILVGDKSAVNRAITTLDTEKRGTLLAQRIDEDVEELVHRAETQN